MAGGGRVEAPDFTFYVFAGCVAAWAVFQNTFRLSQQFVLFDESTYARAGWRYVHGRLLSPRFDVNPLHATPDNFEHPPLAKMMFGLAQLLLGHPSTHACRAVAAICTLLTALVLGIWLSCVAGRWVGVLAGAFVALLPTGVSGADVRFGRYAMLDPVAEMFMVGSLALGWAWSRQRGRASWWMAVATGVAVGCATSAKENGFLGIVGPAALMVALTGRDRSLRLQRALQVSLAALTALAVFIGWYLPLGRPVARLRYLVRYASAHAQHGHLVGFAGRVSLRPPWWANLWFAGHGLGAPLTAVLGLSALTAVALRRDVLVCWLLAALAMPFLFHLFLTDLVLNYYWVMWLPAFLALAALGIHALVVAINNLNPSLWPPIATLALLLTVPAASAAAETGRVATLHPQGTAVLGKVMRAHGLHGPVVVAGLYSFELHAYPPALMLIQNGLSADASIADTIVVGRPRCRLLVDASVRALVAVNLHAGLLRRVYRDSRIDVYGAEGPLIVPTALDAAAQAPGSLAEHC